MKLSEILPLVEGEVVTKGLSDDPVLEYGMASDLMSDVLTLDVEHTLLITGLANLQTIRTAEMSDIHCILFARNKKASPEMIELAEESEIVLVESKHSMFNVCGMLYEKGIKPLY
jgi:predicted transcriptional regulator